MPEAVRKRSEFALGRANIETHGLAHCGVEDIPVSQNPGLTYAPVARGILFVVFYRANYPVLPSDVQYQASHKIAVKYPPVDRSQDFNAPSY